MKGTISIHLMKPDSATSNSGFNHPYLTIFWVWNYHPFQRLGSFSSLNNRQLLYLPSRIWLCKIPLKVCSLIRRLRGDICLNNDAIILSERYIISLLIIIGSFCAGLINMITSVYEYFWLLQKVLQV